MKQRTAFKASAALSTDSRVASVTSVIWEVISDGFLDEIDNIVQHLQPFGTYRLNILSLVAMTVAVHYPRGGCY